MEKEFESIADELFRKQPEIEIKRNIVDATSREPDKYAETYSMAKENDLPVETVENNFDDIKRRTRVNNFNSEFDNLFKENLKTLDFMKDKDNARLSYDDIDGMGRIERSFGGFIAESVSDIAQWSRGELFAKARMGFEQGVATNVLGRLSSKQQTGQVDFQVSQERIDQLNEILSDDPGREGFVNGFIYPGAKIIGQIVDSSRRAGYAGIAAGTAAFVAGQAGPQIATAEEIVTVPLAFGTGFIASLVSDVYVIEAGHTYQTLNQIEKEAGQEMEPFVKNGIASFVGLANAGLEMVGVKYASAPIRSAITKYFTEQGKDLLVDKTKSAAIKKFAAEYVKAIGGETSTEVMQEVVSVIGEQLAGTISYEDFQGQDFNQNVDRILNTATETMRGMALIGLAGPGLNLHVDYAKAKKAQRNKELMLSLGDETKNSKLFKRAPGKYNEFIAKIKGKVSDVYIDAQQFDTYFQSKNIDPSEIARQLGVESKLAEARIIGGDFEIPLENYAEKLAATDFHPDLVNYIKFEPGDITSTQAEDIVNQGITSVLQEEYQIAQENESQRIERERPAERVFDEVRTQLRSAGRSFDVAEKEATLWRSFFNTMSEKTGVDAYSLYRGQNVTIQRELPVILQEAKKGKYDTEIEKLKSYKGLSDKKLYGASLLDFISEKGGINPTDMNAQDLLDLDIDKYHLDKPFVKKVFNPKEGKFLDDLALEAWEGGYFPEFASRPSINELIAKIDSELRGDKQYSSLQGDFDLQQEKIYLEDLDRFLNEIGADINTMSNKEINALIDSYQDSDVDSKTVSFFQRVKDFVRPKKADTFLQETGDKRGAFITGQGQKVIKLFEKADLSTFLHESGHFFLEVMGETSSQENAPQGIVDDYNAILKFLEVESSDQIKTKHHEKFAKAFEAYLYEGKAPSVDLQNVFTRFKTWLISVYKNIRNLEIEINDELRGVFDRMLATEEEIENAEQLNNYAPVLTEDDSGMTTEEYNNYLKTAEKATIKSEEELLKKTMSEIKRENLAWYKNEKERVRKEVTEGVMMNPANQAMYYLDTGELYIGEIREDLKNRKLDSTILKETYGKSVLKRLPKSIHRRDGVHPDIVADVFGYDSGNALIETLLNTEDVDTTIENQTDAIMKERHGDILNDGTIQEEAQKSVRNDERATFITTELLALGKKAGRDLPSAKDIAKGAARRMLSEIAIKDLKISKYTSAEVKASRLTQQAVAEGNFAEAVNQKRRQLLNHYLAMEGRKIQDNVDKGLKYLKKFNKKETRARIGKAGADYLEQIEQLLEKYELKRSVTLKRLKSRQSLITFVESEKEKGNPVNVSQEVIDQASVVNYRNVPTEEFFGLVDSVKNIEHLASFKNKLLINNQKREIREIAQEIGEIAQKNLKPKKEVFNPGRKRERRKSFLRGLGGAVTKIQTYIEKLGGGEKIGPVYQYLKAPIDEATNVRAERMVTESDKFSQLMNKYYGKKPTTAVDKARSYVDPVENITSEKTNLYFKSINESLTLEERLTVA
jgi:hypothetical protein